ncbi:MAG: helix-turn-helix domain-containing protein [Caldilineaceae bacterium]
MEQTNALPQQFGVWLRRVRNQQDLTQEALAELANCSVQAIRSFESGRRRPSLILAEHLAAILQIPLEERSTFVHVARRPLPAATAVLDEATLSQSVDGKTGSAATLPSLEQTLIGREGERNVLRQLLVDEQRRLITVVSAGGMGKTHLVLDLAAELAVHYTDGVLFVALSPLRSAAHLPAAIAGALNIRLAAAIPRSKCQLRCRPAIYSWCLTVLKNCYIKIRAGPQPGSVYSWGEHQGYRS